MNSRIYNEQNNNNLTFFRRFSIHVPLVTQAFSRRVNNKTSGTYQGPG